MREKVFQANGEAGAKTWMPEETQQSQEFKQLDMTGLRGYL